jgi:hypothetical protein
MVGGMVMASVSAGNGIRSCFISIIVKNKNAGTIAGSVFSYDIQDHATRLDSASAVAPNTPR